VTSRIQLSARSTCITQRSLKYVLLFVTLIVASSANRIASAQEVGRGPRLAGAWTLNLAKSEDVEAKLKMLPSDTRDPGRGTGGGGGGGRGTQGGGGRGRPGRLPEGNRTGRAGNAGLIQVIHDLVAGDDQLIISETPGTVTMTTSDGRVTKLATNGKPASSSIAGRSIDRTVTLSGDQLIEHIATSDGWTVTRTVMRRPAGGQLEIRLEARRGGASSAVEIRRTYDPVRRERR